MIVAKIEASKDRENARYGSQLEQKAKKTVYEEKIHRSKNNSVGKFYEEFYQKQKADSLVQAICLNSPKGRTSPTSVLSSKHMTPKLPEVRAPGDVSNQIF